MLSKSGRAIKPRLVRRVQVSSNDGFLRRSCWMYRVKSDGLPSRVKPTSHEIPLHVQCWR